MGTAALGCPSRAKLGSPWPSPGLPGKHRLVDPSSAADSFRLVECRASPRGLNYSRYFVVDGRDALSLHRLIQAVDSELDSGHRKATKERNKNACINSSVVVNYITRWLARIFGAVASESCRPEGSCRDQLC